MKTDIAPEVSTLLSLEIDWAFLKAQCEVMKKQLEGSGVSNPNHPLASMQAELSDKIFHWRRVQAGILAIKPDWQPHPAIDTFKLDVLLASMQPSSLSDHLEGLVKQFEEEWMDLKASVSRRTTIVTSVKAEALSDSFDDSRAEIHRLEILINYLRGALLHLPGGVIE